MSGSVLVWAMVLVSGCAVPEGGEIQGNAASLGELRLARGATHFVPPEGGDGPGAFEVRWSPGGAVFPAPAIAAREWRDAAVVIDADRTLHLFGRDGRVEAIADRASSPVASPARLAYVQGDRYGSQDVRVRDAAGQETVVAHGLLSASLLGFDDGDRRLHLIAAGPGGVVGLHVIDLESGTLECRTNCRLRTGEDWGDAFVELPSEWPEVQP